MVRTEEKGRDDGGVGQRRFHRKMAGLTLTPEQGCKDRDSRSFCRTVGFGDDGVGQ